MALVFLEAARSLLLGIGESLGAVWFSWKFDMILYPTSLDYRYAVPPKLCSHTLGVAAGSVLSARRSSEYPVPVKA